MSVEGSAGTRTAVHTLWRGPIGQPGWNGFDATRTRGRGWRDQWRSYRAAVRLGWEMEANWTDPLLFFIHSVAQPLSAALILIVMLEIVAGEASRELRGFVVTGSALWSIVISGIGGLAWSILDDRETYRMLRYVYVSPSDFLVVLLGRGTARIAVGAMGASITLAVGIAVLGIPFDPGRVNWPLLAVSMVAGLVSIVAGGVLMAAVCLHARQEAWSYPEAAAGALFIVSGVVFPLAVLPPVVQLVGLAMPYTWWLAAVRLALFPDGPSSLAGTGAAWAALGGPVPPDIGQTLFALLVTGALGVLVAALVFRASERRAKDGGLLDQTTGS
jgi:ABC-2 type transport system permease protein